MLVSFNKIVDAKSILAVGVLASILGFGVVSAHAQADTTLNLTINAGVLTMYAGDNTNNDDLCTPASDNSTVESVACGAGVERSATLTAINVASVRQNSTTTIEDILFEDLRGLAQATYAVTAEACDLTDGTKVIDLGTNPDALADDTDTDASSVVGQEGYLFATLDPSAAGSAVDVLRPQSAIDEYTADPSLYVRGPKTTVVDDTTQITVFTGTDVIPGRTDLDGATLKHRIPAFVEAGSYSCQMTFTVTAS